MNPAPSQGSRAWAFSVDHPYWGLFSQEKGAAMADDGVAHSERLPNTGGFKYWLVTLQGI
mgnify:CR=1 FL=1